jgi:hypothetical protein
MSYDFMVMKPRAPVRSAQDLNERSLVEQPASEVKAALSKLLPGLAWSQQPGNGAWSARVEDEGQWYEFLVGATPEAWAIFTSLRPGEHPLVARICKALGVVAMDCQTMAVIQ